MSVHQITIFTIFILSVLFGSGQIKSNYAPFEYSADTTKDVCISEFQLDSLKYEILYYKDVLEETQRTYLLSLKTKFTDTVLTKTDSVVIKYYSVDTVLLLKKVFEFRNQNKSSYFLNEDYFLNNGKRSYSSRCIISDENELQLGSGKNETFGSIELLQSRFRYVYDSTGRLSKVVAEFRVGGAGIRLFEFINDKKIEGQDFRQFTKRKISIWEFWN